MQHVLITGSNRGIGLGLVKEFLSREDWHIIATCRNPADASELRQIAEDTNMERVTVVELDVSSQDSIDRAFNMVTSEITDKLDVLINNAGINPKGQQQQSFEKISFDTMLHVLRVNTAAPLQITQAAYPLLTKSENPRVVNISSSMGSISRTGSSGAYAYRISKAGINMLSKTLSNEFNDIIVITLDPGWVQTDMGGSGASLTPEKSANGIVNVVSDLAPAQSGSYLKWDGSHHEW